MTVLAALIFSLIVADDSAAITQVDKTSGIVTHEVESSFQGGKTRIRVLLPAALKPEQKYAVIYVLPVEPQSEARYGDGLAEVKQHDLHNKHPAIFVAPTFSHLPWYTDHLAEPTIQQETYFLKVVVPFVE